MPLQKIKCNIYCFVSRANNSIKLHAKNILSFLLIFLLTNFCEAQQIDSITKSYTFSGAVEMYASQNIIDRKEELKSDIIYNHKVNNALGINLAYLKFAYLKNRWRINIAAMAGDYAYFNLAAEPLGARFVYEENIGYKLSQKYDLWIDAGIMPSHIGFESAFSNDCFNLTRSLCAETTPYYETGARLSYRSKNEKLYAALLYLNGYQTIQPPKGASRLNAGMQLTYKHSTAVTFNYSNYIGTAATGGGFSPRLLNNLYALLALNDKMAANIGLDVAFNPLAISDGTDWITPVAQVQYKISSKVQVAARSEYYGQGQFDQFSAGFKHDQIISGSINADYIFSKKARCRFELKDMHSFGGDLNIPRFSNALYATGNVVLSF